MAETDPPGTAELVAGRSCGECNVCCVVLTIDEPTLMKARGYRCRHAQPDNGCGIYDSRPQTCRAFYCGWRRLKWVRETLRPDRSGVLVRLHYDVSWVDGTKRLGVIFTLLTGASLRAEGLAETVAAAVAAGLPTFLEIPGPPGFTSGLARINDAVAEAVVAKDKKALLQVLRRGRAQGRGGEHRPIVFASRPAEGHSA